MGEWFAAGERFAVGEWFAAGERFAVGRLRRSTTILGTMQPVEWLRAPMHPVEWLRHVDAAVDAVSCDLARDAVIALDGVASDPVLLVAACRRMVDRHPACGALWWVASRYLTDLEPESACRRLLDELDGDPTESVVARVVRGAADLVLVEASAASAQGFFTGAAHAALAKAAAVTRTPVWVVARIGTVLPPELFRQAALRVEGRSGARRTPGSAAAPAQHPARHAAEWVLCTWAGNERLVCEAGVVAPEDIATVPTCPVALELAARA